MSERAVAVAIYTRKWTDDHAAQKGELADATVSARVFFDGREVRHVLTAEPHYAHDEFTTVTLVLHPSSVQVVECDDPKCGCHQLAWLEHMERIEQEVFLDARPRSEVVVVVESVADEAS